LFVWTLINLTLCFPFEQDLSVNFGTSCTIKALYWMLIYFILCLQFFFTKGLKKEHCYLAWHHQRIKFGKYTVVKRSRDVISW